MQAVAAALALTPVLLAGQAEQAEEVQEQVMVLQPHLAQQIQAVVVVEV
jgi:hypothetical protein